MDSNIPYIDRATKYASDVVNGKIVAGELHRLACQRHLNDLKRQRTKDFPYYYDTSEANAIIEYAETLTIAEGFEPKRVKLKDSQAFDLAVTFGWYKVSNDKRRFRRRYKSMARQNGKTFENGIMGTYIAGFGGYNHGKLFTVATKKRQARLAWEEMSKFIGIDPDLRGDDIADAIRMGADAYVSGRLGYHPMTEAPDMGITLIEAGHFFTEQPVCERLSQMIKNIDATIECDLFFSNRIKLI